MNLIDELRQYKDKRQDSRRREEIKREDARAIREMLWARGRPSNIPGRHHVCRIA